MHRQRFGIMKIFQTTQKNMRFGGYEKNRNAFNSTHRRFIMMSFLSVISYTVYTFYMANTPRLYLESLLALSSSLLALMTNISTVFKKTKIFDLIDDIEVLVNESECYLSVISYIHFGYYRISKNTFRIEIPKIEGNI